MIALLSPAAQADGTVVELELKGGIGVATADYIISGIEYAEDAGAKLIIINMDTPGGLMAPMRDIVQAILGSSVPVATYVTPAGARAASAGTYILLASHIAAMAPTTHLGAATPVSLTGDDATPENSDDETSDDTSDPEQAPETDMQPGTAMERKVLNDAIAYIRGLADRYGRNADWAEDAVVNATTLTATDALEQNVIEFVAENRADLLQQINGYEVEIESEAVVLDTSEVIIDTYEPNWRIKILSAIANPEIVLLLGIIGLYGLMYEGWNPGAIVPGVVGVICLLLAAYALQVLPVNYAGLALIIVGLALMTAEAFAPSFGALGLGGNYPNPFNPATSIPYEVPAGRGSSQVRLDVVDLQGRVVRTLVADSRPTGRYVAVFDGLDRRGTQLPSGSYLARLKVGGAETSRVMTLVK
ncbi:MAG: nodulation protein NfeD [Desulfobulbaceae bacterium]|nr:nodulation protein NfeD [Desulfobulbaceae bacterium]